MLSINANTGLLFTAEEERAGQGLVQSIYDRMFTLPGDRIVKKEYGTLYNQFIGNYDLLEASIRRSFLTDARVTSVNFAREEGSLRATVNGQINVQVTT